MSFTSFEKKSLQKLIRTNKETEKLRKTDLDPNVYDFLKNENLLRHIRDHGIFPQKYRHKINYAENIILSKYFDNNFDIIEFIEKLGRVLTGPYHIQIDCAMIIKHGQDENIFRFVWAQRNLAFNTTKLIRDEIDLNTLISEIKSSDQAQFMKQIYSIHQNQSCFDRSGYLPLQLLSTVFFLSKI